MAPFPSARRCLACLLIIGCSSGAPAGKPEPEPEPEPDGAAVTPPRTPPPDSAAAITPPARDDAAASADSGSSPDPDAGTPPASGGDEGLQRLLVGSAIGLGYYTACHIIPDLSVRCFGDRHPRTM